MNNTESMKYQPTCIKSSSHRLFETDKNLEETQGDWVSWLKQSQVVILRKDATLSIEDLGKQDMELRENLVVFNSRNNDLGSELESDGNASAGIELINKHRACPFLINPFEMDE
uniref:Uncharacterized protein n=1 Tax=Fundulus heteroclitus TaxID=8078 RepID=A0A146R6N1_FUNHE